MDGPHIEGNEALTIQAFHGLPKRRLLPSVWLLRGEKLLQTRQGLQPTKTCYENKQMAASLGLWQYTTVSLNVSKIYRYIYIIKLYIYTHMYLYGIASI